MIQKESRRERGLPRLGRTLVALYFGLGLMLVTDQAQAGLSFKKGSFTKNTATGSQAVTGVGFQPEALIFFWTRQTATGSASNSYLGTGFATGSSNERAVAYASDDADGNAADSAMYQSQSHCLIMFLENSATAAALAELTSFDADGFTLNWTTNEARADIIHYVALGGTDLTNATASSFTVTTGAGSQSVTGLGFQPDFLLFLSAASNTVDTRVISGRISLGFASGASAQAGLVIRSDDASDPSDTCVQQRTDNAIVEISSCPSTAEKLISLTSFDADGFTLNKTTAVTGMSWRTQVMISPMLMPQAPSPA